MEVTERVLAENQDRMAGIIDEFHQEGFEVWLDDFGSAYSSLKSLNQFPFDLIKLDMDFFRKFDERSKAIITSIIIMAKRLGMHTLAEGVETKEHLQFLEEIGCERIQGFYYGKPVPRYDVDAEMAKKKLQMESSLEASVYGSAGLVNLIREDPCSLFLYENGTVRNLIANEAFQQQNACTKNDDTNDALWNIHKENQPRHRRLMRYLDQVYRGDARPELFIENGQFIRLNARFVAGVKDFWVGSANLMNFSFDHQMAMGTRRDQLLVQTASLFDGVYLLNLVRNQIEVVQCRHPRVKPEEVFTDIQSSFFSFSHELVYLDDQPRFQEFTSVNNLIPAIQASSDGYVQDAFRIRREDGSYKWTLFVIEPVQYQGARNLLMCERHALWADPNVHQHLLPKIMESLMPGVSLSCDINESGKVIQGSDVMHAFFRFAGIPLFWKDKQGRYLEVNQEMLSYLGVSSRDEVIGKTADSLSAFVDPKEVKARAEAVLKHGQIVHFSPMAASGGITRRIPVTEFPWYRGNQIAGAAGWIHTGEEVTEQAFITDEITGMLNDYGGMLAGSTFDDALRKSGKDYCTVLLEMPGYVKINRTFGNSFSRSAVKRIAAIIAACPLPSGTVRVHLRGCRFLLIGKEDNELALKEAGEKICQEIRSIGEVDGVECHFEMNMAMAAGSQAEGFVELVRTLDGRLHQGSEEISAQNKLLQLHQNILLSLKVLNTSPERIVIIDPENDDVLYMNRAMKRALNLPENFSWQGRKCYDVLQGRDTPCDYCTANMLPMECVASRRQKFETTGAEYVTREILVPWKDRLVRLAICMPYDENSSSLGDLLHYEMWANRSITSGMAEKDPSAGIQKTIDHIGLNLQAERFLLFEERADKTVCCTYEWCSSGQPALKNELQSVLMQKLDGLYHQFETNKVVMISDYDAFCKEHPDFYLPGYSIHNVISGHLMNAGRSLGFTLVLNSMESSFQQSGYILSTLTDFLAVMVQNRNNIHDALERSRRDPMTGVLNRAGLHQYLTKRTRQESVAVISGDINGLKAMNDNHGHLAGDKLICDIANVLISVSDKDHVVRMGGDEFLLIKEGMDDAGARDLIRQIKETLRAKGLSMAIGYTIHTGALDDIDEVVKEADKAMYDDKGHYYHRRRTDEQK